MSEENTGTQTAFKRLSHKEAAEMLATVYSKKLMVLFKFDDSTVFKAKPMDEKTGISMVVSRPDTVPIERHGQEVTGHFSMLKQVYFFRAKLNWREKHLSLHLVDGLHKLIRRRDDRYMVPADKPMEIVTKRVGDTLTFVRGSIQDFSLRGCRAAFLNKVEFKAGDPFTAVLRFGEREPIVVHGIIRHQIPVKTGLYVVAFGMEITDSDSPAGMLQWILDLQQAAFAALPKKS